MKRFTLPQNPSRRALVRAGLLLMGILLLTTACRDEWKHLAEGSSSCPTGPVPADERYNMIDISGRGDFEADWGDPVHREIEISGGGGMPASVAIAWKPPDGASNVRVTLGGLPPAYQRDDGAYVFHTYYAGYVLVADYDMPYYNIHSTWFVDERVEIWDLMRRKIVKVEIGCIDIPGLASYAARTGVSTSASSLRPSAPADDDDYYYQHVVQEFWSQGVTMTTDMSQDIVETWQRDSMVYALEIPIPPEPITYFRTMPVQFHHNLAPTLRLVDFDNWGATVVTAPLEYRPDRFGDLSTIFPPQEDTMLVPMGVGDQADFAPEPFELEHWMWTVDMTLDLGGQPMNQLTTQGIWGTSSAPPVIKTYYCFQDDSQSAMTAILAQAWGGTASARTPDGFTCVGPRPVYLTDDPTITLGPAGTGEVSPTKTISFSHYLYPNEAMTLTLDYTSTLNAEWGFYRRPDLTDPITPNVPFLVQAAPYGLNFWAAARVPTGTVEGAYNLVITATPVLSPSLAVWTADSIWVGVWTPPPYYEVYLPLVLRH